MVQPTCYQRSCWCCICRVFSRCCRSSPVIEVVNKAALESIGGTLITQVTHARAHERTKIWYMTQTGMRYDVKEGKT